MLRGNLKRKKERLDRKEEGERKRRNLLKGKRKVNPKNHSRSSSKVRLGNHLRLWER